MENGARPPGLLGTSTSSPPRWLSRRSCRTGPRRSTGRDDGKRTGIGVQAAARVRAFLARTFGGHTDERACRIGAEGEEEVAAQRERLAKKDPRWRLLHAIPAGKTVPTLTLWLSVPAAC